MFETYNQRCAVYLMPFVVAIAVMLIIDPIATVTGGMLFLGIVGFYAFLILGDEWVGKGR